MPFPARGPDVLDPVQPAAMDMRRIMDLLGRPYGGGYLVSPANVLTPEIPFANLEALFEAAHET